MQILIGRIYKRKNDTHHRDYFNPADDSLVVVTNVWYEEKLSNNMVGFFYLNEPDLDCIWNYDVFEDAMELV